MPFSIYQAAPLLSAKHILGSSPSTDAEQFTKSGTFTDEIFFKSRFDPTFASEFSSLSLQSNFAAKAGVISPANDLFTGLIVDDSTVGEGGWTNHSNGTGDTPSIYTYAFLDDPSPDQSYYAKCTSFGFNLPTNVTITGIEVTAKVGLSGPAGKINDNSVKLVKAGSIVGADRAEPTHDWTSSPFTWGGNGDLWGTTWTPAEINSSNFGVGISANLIGSVPYLAYIYTVEIHVYYTQQISYKWQIKPDGQAWENIPGAAQTIILTSSFEEFPHKILLPGSTFNNQDLPADFRLLFTGGGDITVSIETLHNSVGIIGDSVTGTATKYPFDWIQYIISSVHALGTTTDETVVEVDNPSDEIAFVGYVDPGVSGDISDLEINTSVDAYVDAGTQTTDIAWQIRPIGETLWKDVISEEVLLTTTPQNFKYHDDLVESDIDTGTPWGSGLKGPFEFRLVFSATGTGKTFTFKTDDDYNYCRLIGVVD